MNKERLIETFVELCKRDSESLNERKVADYIIEYVNKMGINIVEDNAGSKIGGNSGNLIFIHKGKKEGKILFSAHMDTVAPGINVNPIIDDEKISSDGRTVLGADDKAGIALLLESLSYIKENDVSTPELIFVISVAEEIGLLGASNLEEKIEADYGYILDSSSMPGTIISEAPVHYKYEAIIKGKAAHAGIAPEKGINSIKIGAEIITKIPSGRIDKGTTSNIGIISGGIATNIVPEEVKINGEIRSFNQEKAESLLDEIKSLFIKGTSEGGGTLSFESHKEYDHFKVKDEELVITKGKEAIMKAGLTPIVESAGGGSDGNIYNQQGIPSVIIGLGYEKVHTKEEFIKKENLYKVLDILIHLMKG